MANFKPPKTGQEMWVGKGGSGKSYGVMCQIRRFCQQRRPVFTNLPINWRVFKQYLRVTGKEGESLDRYILPTSREHFLRFLKRNAAYAKFKDAMDSMGMENVEIRERFSERFGPEIIGGKDANWYPPFSCLVFDEIHRWFPQREQDDELLELEDYLSMLRHHVHMLMTITQDAMKVSIRFRRDCHSFIRVRNMLRFPVVLGFKLEGLIPPIFAYQEWPDEATAHERPGAVPLSTWTETPIFDGGLIFRLYRSFSHVSNPRRMRKELERMRSLIEAGTFESLKDVQRRRDRDAQETRRLTGLADCLLGVLDWRVADGGAGVVRVAPGGTNRVRGGNARAKGGPAGPAPVNVADIAAILSRSTAFNGANAGAAAPAAVPAFDLGGEGP